jgi:hypothetical protein
MKPVFCTEVFNEPTLATFSVTFASVLANFTLNWTVPAGLYWLGGLASPLHPSLGDAFCDALEAADPNTLPLYGYTVESLSLNIGAVCRLQRGLTSQTTTITATNAAAQHVLWSLGFRNVASVILATGTVSKHADSTGIPFATWWPKAYQINEDEFFAQEQAVATSRRPGAGTDVASSRQDDRTLGRWWRNFTIQPIHAARMSYWRAAIIEWASIAGLTSNATDAAIDNPDWWWSRTADGSFKFVMIEDEEALVSSGVRYGEYRIVYDDDAPTRMDAWRNLREPNVSRLSAGDGYQQLAFCAALVSGSYIP